MVDVTLDDGLNVQPQGPEDEGQPVQEVGGSMNDHIYRVNHAWWQQYRNDEVWTSVVDVFEDYAVVSWRWRNSDAETKYFQVNYTMNDEMVAFAPRAEWVEVELTYAPKTAEGDMATEEAQDGRVREAFRATVEAVGEDSESTLEAVILAEGMSANGRMYTLKALRSGIKVFENALVFTDHPSASEERDRPERSVLDVVGRLGKPYIGKSKEGNNALRAPLRLSRSADKLRTLIDEGIVSGLSIRAMGKGKVGEDGTFTVEAFVADPFTSVDFVTVPAAGGQVLRESQRDDDNPLELLAADDIRRHRPDLVEELTQESEGETRVVRLREGEGESDLLALQETHRKLEAAHQKLEREYEQLQEAHGKLFKRVREQEGREFLEAQLREAGLPEAAVEKLRQEGKRLIKAYATHGSEQEPDELREAIAANVAAEKKYLAQILPHGMTGGGAEDAGPTVREVEAGLSEAFEGLVPAGTEKIAVQGRG